MTLSQCLADHEFRYTIYPHEGAWSKSEVFREAERLSVPLEPAQAGTHGGDLPRRHSFLSVEPANLILSALKRSEDGEGIVIRLFNPTSERLEGKLRFFKPIASAQLCDLEENSLRPLKPRGHSLQCPIAPKKIITIKARLSTPSTPSTKTRR
jgi:alpha-mannosidase